MSTSYLFIDTNVFLHFRQFTENDWSRCTDGHHATLVVAPVVLSELDKHKDQHSRETIRERAGLTLKNIEKLLKTAKREPRFLRAELRAGAMDLILLAAEPMIDFASQQLDPLVQDDRLLASILEFIAGRGGGSVRLLTTDLGLRVKALALGIETGGPPDEWRLAPELDPSQQEAAKLKQELRELQARIPRLRVHVVGQEADRITVPVRVPELLDETAIQLRVDEIRRQYPKGIKVTSRRIGDDGETTAPRVHDMDDECDKFYASYERYLRELSAHQAAAALTFELNLTLTNEGTMPAEEVEVHLNLPSGLKAWDRETAGGPRPAPREPGFGIAALVKDQVMTMKENAEMRQTLEARFARSLRRRNVSDLRLKKVAEGTRIVAAVEKLNHCNSLSLGSLCVQFPSFEEARSFAIEGSIRAANVPKPLPLKIHVVVRTSKPDDSSGEQSGG